jgi:hypothetical protein
LTLLISFTSRRFAFTVDISLIARDTVPTSDTKTIANPTTSLLTIFDFPVFFTYCPPQTDDSE